MTGLEVLLAVERYPDVTAERRDQGNAVVRPCAVDPVRRQPCEVDRYEITRIGSNDRDRRNGRVETGGCGGPQGILLPRLHDGVYIERPWSLHSPNPQPQGPCAQHCARFKSGVCESYKRMPNPSVVEITNNHPLAVPVTLCRSIKVDVGIGGDVRDLCASARGRQEDQSPD